MPITDAEIKALKRKKRPYKVSIGKGAFATHPEKDSPT
jgi:hypothetical protein